jgi:hypothetical protein
MTSASNSPRGNKSNICAKILHTRFMFESPWFEIAFGLNYSETSRGSTNPALGTHLEIARLFTRIQARVFRPAVAIFTRDDAALPFPLRASLNRVDAQLDHLIHRSFPANGGILRSPKLATFVEISSRIDG